MSTWRTFAELFAGSRRLLAWSVVLSLGQSLLLVPIAALISRVFDHQIPAGDTGGLLLSGAAVLGLYLGSSALGLWTRHIMLDAIKDAMSRLRMTLIEHTLRLPKVYFDRRDHGTLQSMIVQDSERVDEMAVLTLSQLLPAVIVSIALCAVLAVLNLVLFLVLLGVVPLLVLLSKWLGERVRHHMRKWQAARDVYSSQTSLALRAVTSIKVHSGERNEVARQAAAIDELSRTGRDLGWTVSAYTLVQQAVAAAAGVVVLVVGGRAVAKGSMTIGDLLSFYAIVALLLRQVWMALGVAPRVVAGHVSLGSLVALLRTELPQPYRGSRRLSEYSGEVRLDRVSFRYEEEPVLTELTLEVPARAHVALVGPNGAGKSTTLSLLLGLYRPGAGRLLADGVPYDELDMTAFRRSIGVVLQDPITFPATIRENIAYGRPDATPEEIDEAAERATAAEFIRGLPDGYETHAGDDGVRLSGGQRQRLAIARALLARPSLLVLDEPTTHLDDAAIAQLLENLRTLPGSPTLVMITHDLAVAEQADILYELRDGRIAHTRDNRERTRTLSLGA